MLRKSECEPYSAQLLALYWQVPRHLACVSIGDGTVCSIDTRKWTNMVWGDEAEATPAAL